MQHELGNARAAGADILIQARAQRVWFLEFWVARAPIDKGAEAALALPAIWEKLRLGPNAPAGDEPGGRPPSHRSDVDTVSPAEGE